MASTIPPPTQADFDVARCALINMALRLNLDPEQDVVSQMIEGSIYVKAQQMAEIRWLRDMQHIKT